MGTHFRIETAKEENDRVEVRFKFSYSWSDFSVSFDSLDDMFNIIKAIGCRPDKRNNEIYWTDDMPSGLREAIEAIQGLFDDDGKPDRYIAVIREQMGFEPDEFNDYEIAWMDYRLRELVADEARSHDNPWKYDIKIVTGDIIKSIVKVVENRHKSPHSMPIS